MSGIFPELATQTNRSLFTLASNSLTATENKERITADVE
jgi:hypothetical protein